VSADTPDPVAVVTGGNQGLGRAVVEALGSRPNRAGTVYLTGRDEARVQVAADELGRSRRRPEPYRLDVRSNAEIEAFAAFLSERHGGVDVVISNAAARITPERTGPEQVRTFVDTNNFGATRMIRALGPLLRPRGRFLVVTSDFGTLRNLPPHLHVQFDTETMSLADLDQVMSDYVEAVESGTAPDQGWPDSINIPSKVGQTAAARIFARDQRERAARDGRLIAAVCPGLIDTEASRPWFGDMSSAQSPAEAAEDVVALVTEPADEAFYGQLVQHRLVVPWR
jgi:NAD(P)-dependent dehydrogenase (short-subunit alcohol dehydrogenase family)